MLPHRPGRRPAGLGLLLGLLAAGLGLAPARAQTTHVITTSFGPAAASDLISRLLATEFSGRFGENWVVKNIAGAAGTIAANEVMRARPDGSTLLLSPIGPVTVQPYFMAKAGYRTEDLMPICMTTRFPLVLMTHRSSGLDTVAKVVARARASRDPLNFGSTGSGTLPHLSMVTFGRLAGIPLVHVSYRGPAEVQIALEQGGVQLYADLPNLVLTDPSFQAVAVMAPERNPRFPDLPTMREAGYDLDFSIWQGLFAPRGTPPTLIARYEAACEAATRAPAVIAGHERLQMPVTYRGAEDFAAIVAADAARARRIIEEGKLRQAE